jgi:hypothetical protein
MMNFNDDIRQECSLIRREALNGGSIEIYTSPKPAIGAALTTQVKLATLELNNPSGTCNNGSLTLSLLSTSIQAVENGTAVWSRWLSSSDAFVADSDVGGQASTAALRIDNLELFAGGRVNVLSAVLTEP